jgi:hypothetical protein
MEGMSSYGFPNAQHQIAGLKMRKPTPQAKVPISLVALWILELLVTRIHNCSDTD